MAAPRHRAPWVLVLAAIPLALHFSGTSPVVMEKVRAFRDTVGTLLVRMLHNEAEIDFRPACDGARYASASHYYRYDLLIACYHHIPSR